ncbi:MAG: aldo/keto reductase [Deltaproteobacteria bacterium]|nr:aldo/keto reductase [Deltaproteobacteria bacterium]
MSNSTLERREFLKLGGAAVVTSVAAGCATAVAAKPPAAPAPVAAALDPPKTAPPAPAALKPEPAKPDPVAAPTGPPTRRLGRTGIEVPLVSMGVMNADNPNLVRAALDGGIVLFDTAHGYQDGRNEEMLGTILPKRPRESFVICTKVYVDTLDRKTGRFGPKTRGEEITQKLDISLKRLGLDHVDILHLHAQSAREGVLHQKLLRALEKAKQDGKTRFLGVSTHKHEPEVLRAAVEGKLYDVVLTAYNFKQDHHLEVQKAMGEAAAAGLGILAMKTQAGVFWDKAKRKPIDMKAALRWALRDPNVHTAIPGFTTFEQLQDDLLVMRDPALSPADSEKLRGPKLAGLFCQGCEECLGSCAYDLPIPDLMRGYMYGHAYKNREAAQSLLAALDLPRAVCGDCDTCPVVCAKGFDVRERIRDIARLRDVPREFLT